MQFDTNNNIVKLCAQGMMLEGEGKPGEAQEIFLQAWNESINDLEKFTSAHYVARHQKTIADKLHWDETALNFALRINDEGMKTNYPSLYLNIAKCYEDLNDHNNAEKNYQLAFSFANLLPDDGYGKVIKQGIENGMKRVMEKE
ncbi:MAG TPA: rRNA adenine methyltransferase [Puia sp.]|jgi:rifampin ADP-ribosylating transferase|nr:rRNA adenine methyltransferase [Puia sp.]